MPKLIPDLNDIIVKYCGKLVLPSSYNIRQWRKLSRCISNDIKNNFKDIKVNNPYKNAENLEKMLYERLDFYQMDYEKMQWEIHEDIQGYRNNILKSKADFLRTKTNNIKYTGDLHELAKYFEKMFTNDENKSVNYYKKELENIGIENKIDVLFDKSNITVEDLSNTILNNLSKNKDMYGISYSILNKLLYSISNTTIRDEILDIFNSISKYNSDMCESNQDIGNDIGNDIDFEIDMCNWNHSIIYPGYKKGASNIPSNYRPLMKFSILTRIYNRIISKRLYEFLVQNKILDREIQKGFADVFGGVFTNVNVCKNIMKDAICNQNPLVIIFLDIKNAYGSINYNFVKALLQYYNLPPDFVKYVIDYYNTSSGEIRNDAKYEMPIKIQCNIGVHQGCSLGNIIFLMCFNIFIEMLTRKYDYGYIVKKMDKLLKIFLMAFVDDLSVVCNDINEGNEICNDMVQIMAKFGIFLNYDKCRYLSLFQKRDDDLIINGNIIQKLEYTDKFKYLGSIISTNTKYEIEKYCEDLRIKFEKLDALEHPVKTSDKIHLYKQHINRKIQWDMQMVFWSPGNFYDIEFEYLTKWQVINPRNFLITRNERILNKRIVNYAGRYRNSPNLYFFIDTILKDINDDDIEQLISNMSRKGDNDELNYVYGDLIV